MKGGRRGEESSEGWRMVRRYEKEEGRKEGERKVYSCEGGREGGRERSV